MTEAQRTSLINLMDAILAVSTCPSDIRFRAENLRDRLVVDATAVWLRGAFAR